MTLDDTTVRLLRALLRQALDLLPDPDAPVHAHDCDRTSRFGGAQALCGRAGKAPRLTDDPAAVTCAGCRGAYDFDAWAWRHAEEEGACT